MKAVVQTRFAAPEHALTLTDRPIPRPGPGDVLIRMRATSLNTPDWTVEAVGEGVTDLHPGDDVFGSLWTGAVPTAGLGRMAGAALTGRLRRADVRFVTPVFDREHLASIARLLETGQITPSSTASTHSRTSPPPSPACSATHRARGDIVITMGP